MLSTVNHLAAPMAIAALGYAADWGINYYENVQKDLLYCRMRQTALFERNEKLRNAVINMGSISYDPCNQELRNLGSTIYCSRKDSTPSFVLFNEALDNCVQEKNVIEGKCDEGQRIADTFAAKHIAPYFSLVSDASLPAAGLAFMVKVGLTAFRTFMLNPKNN